ncbi:3-isopropylmalate dehydrogenase [Arcanobacterium bovis]|uniref:3-isopropylmalate dehydrogenase n=1 Tax=Arcanobacterium bovis TaxID=2529275 RepID=A0A4Q9V0M4_9ACTO|nr:3-isopropylmalate dehydrogenase [Arcanobacterium bovis]TBW20920.1 3-isopropylmalate dehydrogenase [Arcanobacterium bovis]
MAQSIDLAVIPGDGIGPEVVAEGLRVLRAVTDRAGIVLNETCYDLGASRWHRTGDVLSDDDLASIKRKDVILLGAVGDPSTPSGLLERGLLLKLRFELDHYVNLRPSRYYDGVVSPLANPRGVDFVVVREGTEGLYCGNGGAIRVGTPQEMATEVSVNTAFGVERVVRFAFEQAVNRRNKLTLVHKHNVLVHAGHLWRRTVERVGREYPSVVTDYIHVDAATIYLVTDPQRFDVIVTDNLFGDILTDEAGAITGGIGLAASGNINPEREFPSMFEPVHGSAPDIAGTGKADPTATILSVAMMLDFLGHPQLAQSVNAAVEADMAQRAKPAAEGKKLQRSTTQIGRDILNLL